MSDDKERELFEAWANSHLGWAVSTLEDAAWKAWCAGRAALRAEGVTVPRELLLYLADAAENLERCARPNWPYKELLDKAAEARRIAEERRAAGEEKR